MLTLFVLVLLQPCTKTVCLHKKRNQQKSILASCEILNEFIIGNGTNVSAMEKETLQQQTNGQHNDLEMSVDSASQHQVKKI